MIIDNLDNYKFETPTDFDVIIKSIGHVVWGSKKTYSFHVLPTKEFLTGKHNGISRIEICHKKNFLTDIGVMFYKYYFNDIVFIKRHDNLNCPTIKVLPMHPHYPGITINLYVMPIVKYKFDPYKKIDQPEINCNQNTYYITHNFLKSILAIYQIFPRQFLKHYNYTFDEFMEYLKIKKNSDRYKQLLVHTITKRLIDQH